MATHIYPHAVSRPQFRKKTPAFIKRFLVAIKTMLRLWRQRSRERRELASMTELDLQDIGMTFCERTWQIRKPFWKE